MKFLTLFALFIAFFGALIGFGYLKFNELTRPLPKPEVDANRYWGRGDGKGYKPDETIYEFKVHASKAEIEELRKQLNHTLRLTEPLEGTIFEYGFNSGALEQYVEYWRDNYLPKWQEREDYLNKFSQYKTEIQGLHIHYIHQKPPPEVAAKKKVVPLLLLHGWPGSVREFYDFIPMLTNDQNVTAYAFDVVAPSLVGFGFSDAAPRPGFNAAEMATVMRNLMLRLGYEKFIVQGGDWGSIIGSNVATLYPDNVIAYHSNMCILNSPLAIIKGIYAHFFPDNYLANKLMFYHHHFPIWEKYEMLLKESGYFHLQATKPDTIGAALDASPVALAAYVLEKFQTATGPSLSSEFGAMLSAYGSIEAVLDNLMYYYLGRSSTTAARFYAENVSKEYRDYQMDRVQSPVPMGCVRFINDLPPALDWQLRDKFPNLMHSSYIPKGGHFAALEMPSMLYSDFAVFLRKLNLDNSK